MDYLPKIVDCKNKLDACKPFSQTQLKNLQQRFRIGFTHHTNAIEGNTFSLTDVKVLLEDGITVGGKTIKELRETINHGEVLTRLHDLFDPTITTSITKELVLDLHATLMQDILGQSERGQWRTHNVRISGVEDMLPEPNAVPGLMDVFFTTTAKHIKTLSDVARLHYDFVKIHPFADGNGRIARLLMNISLVKLGYFPIIIPIIVRKDYIDSLVGDNFAKRYEFFLWQVYENHKDYLRFFSKG